jgi:hypothetical protein
MRLSDVSWCDLGTLRRVVRTPDELGIRPGWLATLPEAGWAGIPEARQAVAELAPLSRLGGARQAHDDLGALAHRREDLDAAVV